MIYTQPKPLGAFFPINLLNSLALLIFLSLSPAMAYVGNTNGTIQFDAYDDQNPEMVVNSNGVGILTSSPSQRLDVAGNAAIQSALSVSGDLNIDGFWKHDVAPTSSNTTLGANSVILFSGNNDITLTLPVASSVNGLSLQIKCDSSNNVTIESSSNIDGRDANLYIDGSQNSSSSLGLVSLGDQWGLLEQPGSAFVAHLHQDLWAWYKLDETSGTTANDSSPNARHGTYNNIASADIGVSGFDNKAVSLDGSDDHVLTPADSLDTTNMTITAWVYLENDSFSGIVFSNNNSSGIHYDNSSDQLRYHWSGSYWDENTGLTVALNQWTFVAIVVTPTAATLFVNNDHYTHTDSHAFGVTTDHWKIGTQNNSRRFDGLIDDVRFFTRSLTHFEVGLVRTLRQK